GEGIEVKPEMYATGDFRITALSLERLQASGVPEDVIKRLDSKDDRDKYVIKGKKFATDDEGSGEQKLTNALTTLLGKENTAEYKPLILKYAFLYKVSPFWLIFAYAVVTLAELMLSPMGLSLVAKVAPVRLRGVMMGGWFVATAIGNSLTRIGVYWDHWFH